MTTINLNIAHLIEKNSMTRLSKDYENRLLTKIKENFNENQQQLFAASFYCYLNYDKKKDFVIDFDNVWKWLGFARKDPAKRALERHFTVDIDYQVIKPAPPIGGAGIYLDYEVIKPPGGAGIPNLGGAGLNKETILLSVNTFKKFCLKAGTKKADEVHDYYLKLEELLQETVNEESNELRIQLGNQTEEKKKIEEEKKKIEDKLNKIVKASTLRKQLSDGEIIYVGINELDTTAFKVGITCKPNSRVNGLSGGTTTDFEMKRIWYTRFNKEIEDAVKKNYTDQRLLQRKELYNIDEYDNIVSYIEQLVKVFNDTDRFKPEIVAPTKKKQVKNPLKLPEKPCNVCNEIKPLEEFHFAKEHTDGRENRCKVCAKALQEECTQCKETFPLDGFYVDSQKFDGRGTKCKTCFKKNQKKDQPKIHVTEYCCMTCKVTKPIDDFHKLKKSKTGHQYTCKQCLCAKVRERYQKNKT
jgi:hypothetical protein